MSTAVRCTSPVAVRKMPLTAVLFCSRDENGQLQPLQAGLCIVCVDNIRDAIMAIHKQAMIGCVMLFCAGVSARYDKYQRLADNILRVRLCPSTPSRHRRPAPISLRVLNHDYTIAYHSNPQRNPPRQG